MEFFGSIQTVRESSEEFRPKLFDFDNLSELSSQRGGEVLQPLDVNQRGQSLDRGNDWGVAESSFRITQNIQRILFLKPTPI